MNTGSIVKDEKGVYLDSLPYVDAVHEDYEDYALALIEEEMQRFNPQVLRRVSPVRFRSPLMQQEHKSLIIDDQFQARKEFSSQLGNITRPGTEQGWLDALKLAKSRHESERIRGMLLESEKEDAVEIWKDYNMSLQHHYIQWESAWQRQQECVQDINYQRQQAQHSQLGPQLHRLELEYQEALHRKNQLEHTVESHRRNQTTTS